MKIKFIGIFYLLLILYTFPSIAALDKGKSAKIDKLVQGYHQLKQFNGNVLVAHKGKVIYEKSIGKANFEWDITNTPDTKFRIASITKQFTAVLIMQLVQEGKLGLNQPITQYLTGYRRDTGDQITIHHLLNHTSGLPNYLGLRKFREELGRIPYEVDEFVIRFCSEDLEFKPGSKFKYSNSGYYVLGQLIEKVTGYSYAQALEERIFKPLGMKDTGYDFMKPILKEKASGYETNLNGYVVADFNDMSLPYASGSIYSTARDLALWDVALYSEKLLQKKYIDKMFQIVGKKRGYGYGWEVSHKDESIFGKPVTVVGHGGSIQGFNTKFTRILEDQYLIVLLKNTGLGPLPNITFDIASILYDKPYSGAKPRVFDDLYLVIEQRGVEAAIKMYHKMEGNGKGLDERSLNYFGYQLLNAERVAGAIEFFKLNVEKRPDSSNAHDSLGEAYLKGGQLDLALKHYQKSITLNNTNSNAQRAIERIRLRLLYVDQQSS